MRRNIKFCYLYRDPGNYKNFGSVVFNNPSKQTLKEIQDRIRSRLFDHGYFIAKKWGLPELFFEEYGWDPHIDVEHHEFVAAIFTTEPVTENASIDEFLNLIESVEIGQ